MRTYCIEFGNHRSIGDSSWWSATPGPKHDPDPGEYAFNVGANTDPLLFTASAAISNQPASSDGVQRITGTNVEVALTFKCEWGVSITRPTTGVQRTVNDIKLQSMTVYVGGEAIPWSLMSESKPLGESLGLPLSASPPDTLIYRLRFSSCHFSNGPISISVRPSFRVNWRETLNPDIEGTEIFEVPPAPKEVIVYNKALVYATREIGSVPVSTNPYRETIVNDTRPIKSDVVIMAKKVAEIAKTKYPVAEVNHLLLQSGKDVQEFSKSEVYSALSEATSLFAITHGMPRSGDPVTGHFRGLRPSYGIIDHPASQADPVSDDTIMANLDLTLSMDTNEFKNNVFPASRTAPKRFNFVFLFACGSGAINGKTTSILAFGMPSTGAVDQAVFYHTGTLFPDKLNKASLDEFVGALMDELAKGTPAQEALLLVKAISKYDWPSFAIGGDPYSRFAKVYVEEKPYKKRKDAGQLNKLNTWYLIDLARL